MIFHLIKMKNSYFQREFSESTEERISTFFNFSDDETLLCAVWTMPFSHYGFVVTNKALHWHLKTNNGIKSGGISKNPNAEFQISPHISSESSVASLANSVAEECSKLEIRTDTKTEEFYFTGLTEEKGKTLCDILKFAFTQGTLPQTDLGKLVKAPFFAPLRTFFDEILNIADETSEKLDDFKYSVKKGFHEITHIKIKIKRAEETETTKANSKKRKHSTKTEGKSESTKASEAANEKEFYEKESDPEKTAESEPKAESRENSARTEWSVKSEGAEFSNKKPTVPTQHRSANIFLLNFLDVCASLFFIASIVVILQPQLLKNVEFLEEHFSTIAISVFTILKCAVAFYSKNTARKIIAILLVGISIIAYILYQLGANQENPNITEIFISIVLCLLAYFTFEFSCGFKTENILKKIVAIIILGFILYVAAHFAIYEQRDEFLAAAREFGRQISLFVESCRRK